MTTAEFFLSWPDKRLSPNSREHWASVARAKKRAKRDAYYSVKDAGIGKIEAESLSVRYVIYPPDRRARDQDNIIASLKAYADGIAEAIGIDDSKWNISIAPRGPIEKGGMIKVELEWSAT
jgi:crossover junction endodeoxyribonuclease RusA